MLTRSCATLCGCAILFFPAASPAHEIVGNRMFPATIATEDPGVADELAFPTIAGFTNPEMGFARQRDVSFEYAKRITDDLAISIGATWSHVSPPGGPFGSGANGFQNIETGLKYRLYKNAEHEFVLSAGLEVEWANTGAAGVGAEPFNVYSPTLYFGKGMGDLPDSVRWLRPFAITGQVGYAIPGKTSIIEDGDVEFVPRVVEWGGSIQYSMPYLKSAVADLGLPDFVNRLVPLVEFTFETPVSNTFSSGTVTTGTINPGVLYVGNSFQLGVEAMIPVNGASGRNVGVIGQLHFFLDDIFPNSLGRPIFASSAMAQGR